MTDLPTDGSIRTAFAELRATERERVQPPGADAARRTLRHRRRRAATTAAAGLTAVVLLGAGYLAGGGVGRPEPDRAANPAVAADSTPADAPGGPTRAPGPAVPADEQLSRLAANALGEPPGGGRQLLIADVSRPAGETRGAGHPGVLVSSAGLEPGSYLLRVSCGGTGSVAATVGTGDDEVTATAQCATTAGGIEAGIGEATLTVGPDRQTRIETAPDEAAAGDHLAIVLALVPR